VNTIGLGPQPSLRPTVTTYAGLFLVTLSTLMYEIALTRIFSVTMWYHFAFLAISVALFGLTAGALLVHLLPNRFPEARVRVHLWIFSLLFGISVAASIVIQLFIPVDPKLTLHGAVTIIGTCLVVSVPFVFSGIVVCLALTRFPERINRLYAADLVGAGIGCVLLVFLLSRLDAPSLVVFTGALASLGAVAFAAGAHTLRGLGAGALAVVLLAGFALVNSALQSRGEGLLRIRYAKGVSDPVHLYEKWNSFSRITVDGFANVETSPFGWGMSKTLPADIRVNSLSVTIDSIAGTPMTRYTGDPNETVFLRYDVTNLAQSLRPNADVAVIGVGGGRDILSALEFGQRSVTGIEINKNMLDLLNGRYGAFTGHLDQNPKVRFINDEARSYLARTSRKYDIIQMSMTDTSAAGSAGAYALGENSVYTTQAWNLFLDRLKPGGVLSVSRWYSINGRPPLETYRAAVLAAEVLKERGVKNPRDHILIYKGPIGPYNSDAATILVSPRPFSQSDLVGLTADVTRLQFEPVLTPTSAATPRFAAIAAPAGPEAAVESTTQADISAPTDDRPFFFQMANPQTIWNGQGFGNNDVTVPVLQPVVVLLLLGLIVLGLALACIGLPLLFDRPGRVRRQRVAAFTTYFAAIGLGFLFVEVSQLERLSVFLGEPVYGLTVVLFALLVFSGIGSMLTERLINPARPSSFLPPLAALLALSTAFGLLTPRVISAAAGATTPVRILLSVGLLAPLALVMGMPFTIGMRAADRASGAPTAFLWGVNGATSVCASVFGLVFSIFLGISVAFWTGTLAYAVALIAMFVIIRRPPVGEHAIDDSDLAVHVLEPTARELSPSASRATSVVRPGGSADPHGTPAE
jgi:predicted membrane-bound spermidine synthase